MWKNYLKIAWRNLKRNRGYAMINIGGLAIGMAACLVIALFVRDELSYDDFHAKADRIYRVADSPEGDKWSEGRLHQEAPLAPTIECSFPAVEEAMRVSYRWGRDVLVKRGENTFYEDQFLLADSAFFEVFSFPLVRGNPKTALSKPYSVVITEETAQKYFGDQNPMGKTIEAKGYDTMHELTVTGVAKDPPHNTHLQFDLLASFNTLPSTMPDPESLNSWYHVAHYTYVLLKKGYAPEDVQQGLPALAERYEGASADYVLQPITGIHLRSHFERELTPNSDLRYVYLFSFLALLVLGVACINYMNLATARSTDRAKEVGVRKAIGARRPQVAQQFLGESALLCAAALVLAYVLAFAALPLFNQLTGGAILSLVMIIVSLDGGVSELMTTAAAHDKFHTFNWTWDWTVTAVWVVVVGNLLANLVPYTADQTVVQRYLTTSDEQQAAQSIWTNAALTIPAAITFFALGTALFVFYQNNPGALDPAMQTDAIFPLFIVQQLPTGVSGLLIAGIFAAAMSSLDSSMNSVAAVAVTDYYYWFATGSREGARVRMARWITVGLGVIATGAGLFLATYEIRSLWELFLEYIGLFGGSLAGLFVLGIFTRQGNARGALVGAVSSAIVLYLVKVFTAIHFFLYGAIGILVCVVVGYIASTILPGKQKDLEGLTFYSLYRTRRNAQAPTKKKRAMSGP